MEHKSIADVMTANRLTFLAAGFERAPAAELENARTAGPYEIRVRTPEVFQKYLDKSSEGLNFVIGVRGGVFFAIAEPSPAVAGGYIMVAGVVTQPDPRVASKATSDQVRSLICRVDDTAVIFTPGGSKREILLADGYKLVVAKGELSVEEVIS